MGFSAELHESFFRITVRGLQSTITSSFMVHLIGSANTSQSRYKIGQKFQINVSRQFYILVLAVTIMVDCFYNAKTISLFLLLNLIQAIDSNCPFYITTK